MASHHMSELVMLREWDRAKLFALDLESGALSRIFVRRHLVDTYAAAGFLKTCACRRPIAVYHHQGLWHCQIGVHRWRLADKRLKLVVKPWLFGRTIEFAAPGFKYTCRTSDLGDWMMRTLDPTYDYLDQCSNDFPLWLSDRRKEARKEPECPGAE